MRRIIYFIFCFITVCITKAEVANPEPAKVSQPDGTTLTIQLHGDEFSSHTTTIDGYTVARCEDNAYRYVVLEGDEIIVTDILAHEVDRRDTKELEFCASHKKHLTVLSETAESNIRRTQEMNKAGAVPYLDNFRGLIILVNYNDCSIGKNNPQELFNDMVNKEGYTGYLDEDEGWQEYTGSVRDYFTDSSMGAFVPQFDVVGPVDIDFSMYDANRTSNAKNLVKEALRQANPLVDYTLYDQDGDGVVDMFYVIFAGYASSSSGNDSRLLWPHASYITSESFKLDGMKFSRYACSTSMYGWDTEKRHDNVLCGIGTICHEFSHVLGLRDHYDTDSNGSITPAKWDVMASGSHNDKGRTPVAYNLFERTALGLAEPVRIEEPGNYELPELTQNNQGYMIMSGKENVYFLLENRQQIKWDSSMAGHGMLVWRVDSTDVTKWTKNKVNADPEHQMFELLRAKPKWNSTKTSVTDSPGDPFPGTGNILEITNETNPSLQTINGIGCPYIITHITENNGLIGFEICDESTNLRIEDFSTMQPFEKVESTTIEGKTGMWTFEKACVQQVSDYERVNGNVAALYKSGSISTEPSEKGLESFYISVANPTSMPIIIRAYTSTDGGITWTMTGKNNVLSSKAEETITFNDLNLPPMSCIKVLLYSGSATTPVYVDNIRFIDSDEVSGITNACVNVREAHKQPIYNFGKYTIRCLNGKKYIE